MSARARFARLDFDHAAALAAIGIAVASLLPKSSSIGISATGGFDHVAAYCLLTALSLLQRRTMAGVLVTVLVIFAFGAAIELIQPLFGRSAEWSDLAANAAGILIAAISVTAVQRWRRLHSR